MSEKTRKWIHAAAVRAVRTVAQRPGHFLGSYKQLFAQIQHLLIVGSQNC